MFYVYFLKNRKNHATYIGYTNDLKRRIIEHADKDPELIYYEAYKDKKDAQDRERKLKQRGYGVRWLKQRLRGSLG